MTEFDQKITSLLGSLSQQLQAKNLKIASAESCTGGWIAKAVTDMDGSSQWFDCALVTYSNSAKSGLLAVSQQTLEQYGAVSQQVVKEMVLGLLQRCDADIGVSVSGIAGPGGGTTEKPVGTVWIAWAKSGVFIEAVRYQFKGTREQVRQQSVIAALQGIDRVINQDSDIE